MTLSSIAFHGQSWALLWKNDGAPGRSFSRVWNLHRGIATIWSVTTKPPKLGRRGQAVFASILLAILSNSHAAAAPAPPVLGLIGGDFTILRPGTTEVLGHARYAFERAGTDEVLRGENRYLDGEYDIETDHLELSASTGAPTLAAYEHWFYARGGAPLMSVGLDIKSGMGLCVHYNGVNAETQSRSLSFPSDTYAGASLLIPITYGLLGNQGDRISAHFFACAPGPQLFAIQGKTRGGMRWAHFDGDAVVVEVRPKLGWWDFLILPFVPKIRAWFDPADGFSYLGGELQRYYRGPEVELVRDRKAGSNPSSN